VNGLMSGLAMTLMSPVGGALADAWERRRAMMVTQITAVVVNGTVALLFWLGALEVWHLLLASLAMGTAFAVNLPSRQALMGEIVPPRLLHNATALHTASINLSGIMGPSLAGLLLAMVGPLAVMLTNLVGNYWTVSQLLSIRYRPTRPPKPFRLRGAELIEGFRFCWQNRPLFNTLVVVSTTNFFGLSFMQLMPSLARDALGTGPQGLGILTSSMGGGALIGALLLARLGRVRRADLLLRGAGVTVCSLLVVLGAVDRLELAAPILMLVGGLSALLTALGLAAIQRQVPDELSGRVFGVYLLSLGMMPLGSLPTGALATQIGTSLAVASWGLLGVVVLAGVIVSQRVAARREPVAVEVQTLG